MNTTGKVVNGVVVVENMEFEEGATVTVSWDDSGEVEVHPDDVAELNRRVDEAERGDVRMYSSVEVLARVRKRREDHFHQD